MDKGSQPTMFIARMSEGGFTVSAPGHGTVFAATTIDEALRFIRDKVSPVVTDQAPARHGTSPFAGANDVSF